MSAFQRAHEESLRRERAQRDKAAQDAEAARLEREQLRNELSPQLDKLREFMAGQVPRKEQLSEFGLRSAGFQEIETASLHFVFELEFSLKANSLGEQPSFLVRAQVARDGRVNVVGMERPPRSSPVALQGMAPEDMGHITHHDVHAHIEEYIMKAFSAAKVRISPGRY